RDIELILVNDGSKDNSLDICKNYEYLDNRVKVLDIPNQGVSEARNAGIEYATGTYIQFVDSDDVIAPQRTERMLAATQLYGADL
ncbi:MAG: glycosyltransferase, partial [Christensenella sp.]